MAPPSWRRASYPIPFVRCVCILVLGQQIAEALPVAPPLNKGLDEDTQQPTATNHARKGVPALSVSAPPFMEPNKDSPSAQTTRQRPINASEHSMDSRRSIFENAPEPRQSTTSPTAYLIVPPTRARPYTFSVTRSAHPRKRTFLAIVLTTPPAHGPNKRLDHFLASWKATWPELQWHVQICLRNHRNLRGYNQMSASASALYAVDASAPNFDSLLLFEDDVVAFPGTRWPNHAENDLDAQLDVFERKNGTGLLLGGHNIAGYSVKELTIARKSNNSVVRATDAWGAFAMLIPAWDVVGLREQFARAISEKTGIKLASDDVNWARWNNKTTPGTGGYISVPLLVDHPPGYSITWEQERKQDWMGRRDWWNFPADRWRKWRRRFVLWGCIVPSVVIILAFVGFRPRHFRSLLRVSIRVSFFGLFIGVLMIIATSAAITLNYL